MSVINALQELRPLKAPDGEHVYLGKVEDIEDPLQAGRVRVRVTELHGSEKSNSKGVIPWAMCRRESGLPFWWLGSPAVGTLVFVYFSAGEILCPIYYGIPVYPPDIPAEFKNKPKVWGYADPAGNKLVIDTENKTWKLTLASGPVIDIDNQGSVKITGVKDTEMTGSGKLKVGLGGDVEITGVNFKLVGTKFDWNP